MSSIFNNLRVLGNLDVRGTTTSIESTVVNIADNFLYLNKNLTGGTSAGGIVINTDASGLTQTTLGGVGFTTTTVDVVNGQTWTVGDFIQVSGAADVGNNGLYQIVSVTTNNPVGFDSITVSGGSPADFVQTAFTENSNDMTATVTQVSVSVIQSSAAGVLEFGSGDSVSTLGLTTLPTGALTDYLKLSGVSSGQTATGGIEALGNLTLRSTTSATKGSVIIDETTYSNNLTAGALVVGGGVGIGLNLRVGSDVHVGRDLFVDVQLFVDTIVGNTGVPLTIGNGNSTEVVLATSIITTTVLGALAVLGDIDTTSGVALTIGSTAATSVSIADINTPTTVLGALAVLGSIDTTAAVPLTIGGTTATSVNVGTGASVTDVNVGTTAGTDVSIGNSTGLISLTGVPRYAIVDDSSTTSQAPIITALNPVTRFTGTSSFTYTLPDMDAPEDGVVLTFYKSTAGGIITIAANGADTGSIEGGTISLSTQFDRVSIMFVNADLRWIIV
jgi:hypothetical protein